MYCTAEDFWCTAGGGCIYYSQVCDGTVDCPDHSDEGNQCGKLVTNSIRKEESSCNLSLDLKIFIP